MDNLEFVTNQKLRGFKLELMSYVCHVNGGNCYLPFKYMYDHFRELEDIDMIGQCVNTVEIKNYFQS